MGSASTSVGEVMKSGTESTKQRTSRFAPVRIAVDRESRRMMAGFGPFAKVTKRLDRFETSSSTSKFDHYQWEAARMRMEWFLSDEEEPPDFSAIRFGGYRVQWDPYVPGKG